MRHVPCTGGGLDRSKLEAPDRALVGARRVWQHWGAVGVQEAVEQADEADEGRLELERSVGGGLFRGSAVIVWGASRSRPSQLIRGVGRTLRRQATEDSLGFEGR